MNETNKNRNDEAYYMFDNRIIFPLLGCGYKYSMTFMKVTYDNELDIISNTEAVTIIRTNNSVEITTGQTTNYSNLEGYGNGVIKISSGTYQKKTTRIMEKQEYATNMKTENFIMKGGIYWIHATTFTIPQIIFDIHEQHDEQILHI